MWFILCCRILPVVIFRCRDLCGCNTIIASVEMCRFDELWTVFRVTSLRGMPLAFFGKANDATRFGEGFVGVESTLFKMVSSIREEM